MSGILGILNLGGKPVARGDLASLLARRGPDRVALWSDRPVGLGHTLLSSTPELEFERQPVIHGATGSVIVADVRLDNREHLLDRLSLSGRSADIGDAGLLLEAYLKWGEACLEHCLGDFAFAIWDPRRRSLFCARDHFGMRPFYYHHAPGQWFIFASEPRAILVLPHVPYRINEGRVADYLVPELQWIDYTSTFFDQVFRLPPAETMTVTCSSLNRRKYWTLEPGPALRLPSNEAYGEAMRDVLTKAVRSRLRAAGPVGATLSGGLDSGSVVALASELHATSSTGAFATFSGVGPDQDACVETAAIHAALRMGGLAPHLIDYTRLDDVMPELDRLTWSPDEPFDSSMALPSALYLTAHRQGIRVMLDGAAGDIVLNEGTHVMRLWRQGRWGTAVREASRRDWFHGGTSPFEQSLRSARAALTPDVARRLARWVLAPRRAAAQVRRSIISPEFAKRISLRDRVRKLDETFGEAWIADYHRELASAIHPNITAGRERYGRVASAIGVEPRDPFLDRRVVEFCITVPGSQRLNDGWPKVILRRAMAGRLPDAVRWRRGKEHLGWSFRTAVMKAAEPRLRDQRNELLDVLRPFVSHSAVATTFTRYFDQGDSSWLEHVLTATTLARWLIASAARPVAIDSTSC